MRGVHGGDRATVDGARPRVRPPQLKQRLRGLPPADQQRLALLARDLWSNGRAMFNTIGKANGLCGFPSFTYTGEDDEY